MLAFGKRLWITLVIAVAFATAAHAQAAPKRLTPVQATPKPAATRPAASGRAAPVSGDQVLRHLHLTIAWYRRLSTLSQSSALADNEIAHDRLQRTSLAAVQYAFDFATAAARLIDAAHAPPDTSAAPDSSDDAARLERAATRAAGRVADLQSRLAALDDQISRAPGREQRDLAAQRDELQSEINLALEVQKTILELQRFAANMAAHGVAGTGSLTGQIAEVERSVPEAKHGVTAAARPAASTSATPGAGADTSTAARAATTAPRPALEATPPDSRPRGLIALASDWFSLHGTSRSLADAIDATDELSASIDSIRLAVGRQARTLVRAHAADSDTVDPSQLLQVQHQFDSATTRFRQLSTLLVPIGEQDITVDDARGTLSEWRDIIKSRANDALGDLVLHAAILLASIIIVLFISEVWRRATFRYLHDTRRRRQFLLLRRVAVVIALLVIIVIGFVSEIGSLATYVGFLTAGLAVALQNVILAIVAYFFLIGRYGVRVGDRITLAGVTGRVVDIGLIRIYLIELAGPDLQPTGRIVVLSNAVLFQPAALFKQIPGAEYTWHTFTLSLPPSTDVTGMQAKLKSAADTVYAGYRRSIDEQHATVQRLVDFDTSRPEPQVDVRFSEQALEFVVRYPVLPEQAAANDQVMMKALREAVGQEGTAPAAAASAASPA